MGIMNASPIVFAPFPWWDAVVSVPRVDEEDLKEGMFPPEARSSLVSFWGVPRENRYAFLVCLAPSGICTTYDGALLVELRVGNPEVVRARATVHTLVVRKSSRRSGLGTALLRTAYSFMCAKVEEHCEIPARMQAARGLDMEWSMAPGSCRRRPETLLTLYANGWSIYANAQRSILKEELLNWLENGKNLERVDLTLTGPSLPIGRAHLLPAVSLCGMHSAHFKPKPRQELPQPPPMDKDWGKSYALNMKLMMHRLPLIAGYDSKPLHEKGLKPIYVPLRFCQRVQAFLAHPHNHEITVQEERNTDGHYMVVHALKVQGRQLKGYSLYHTLNGIHAPDLQCYCTVKTSSKADVAACFQGISGLTEVLLAAVQAAGLPLTETCMQSNVQHMHFLLLNSSGQVDFAWHEDTYDLSIPEKDRDNLLSVVVQLSPTFTTAMQVFAFPMHVYSGQGAGVVFHGRAVHRSVSRVSIPRGLAVWKVAAFIRPPLLMSWAAELPGHSAA